MTPENEQGVIVIFAQNCHRFEMEIISIRAEYPDAIIKWRGQELKVEFEYQSSNFYTHGHDPRECDLIVCWNDDYTGALPVIAIKYDSWMIHDDFRLATECEKTAEYWMIEARRLRREMSKLRTRLAELDDIDDDTPGDWRLVDEETRRRIADMSTGEIVAIYGVSDRTARRWKEKVAANGYHKEA